jgi:hypothetical protein
MARIGVVTGIERTGNEVFVIIRGIGRVEDGQILYFKKDSWTVVKKRWIKGNEASFLLKSLNGKVPEVGQKLELVIDDVKFTIEGGHALNVIDCFMLTHKGETLYAVTLHGLIDLNKDDIIENEAGTAWKVLETSMTTSSMGANKRFMILVEALDNTQLLPQQGSNMTKMNIIQDTIIENQISIEPIKEIPKPKKSNVKKSKNIEN